MESPSHFCMEEFPSALDSNVSGKRKHVWFHVLVCFGTDCVLFCSSWIQIREQEVTRKLTLAHSLPLFKGLYLSQSGMESYAY